MKRRENPQFPAQPPKEELERFAKRLQDLNARIVKAQKEGERLLGIQVDNDNS